MQWEHEHVVHIGGETETPAEPASEIGAWRKRIEPWLSAVFQAEHLSLLLGNRFTTGIACQAGVAPVGMSRAVFGCAQDDKVNTYAARMATSMGRGEANIEDQLSAALSLMSGLQILEHPDASAWETAIDKVLGRFITGILATERGIRDSLDKVPSSGGPLPREILVSFLMSFASRAASRARLRIFTTNYDRLIERGCDLAGLRIVDRFVGAIEPEFRSSRLQIDMHYMPPGIRGEPRHLEGVVHSRSSTVRSTGGTSCRDFIGPLFLSGLTVLIRPYREPAPVGHDLSERGQGYGDRLLPVRRSIS
jgi:hypothetical protein